MGNSLLQFWRGNIEGKIKGFLKNYEGAILEVLCLWNKTLDQINNFVK
jgi:hypothetical protein